MSLEIVSCRQSLKRPIRIDPPQPTHAVRSSPVKKADEYNTGWTFLRHTNRIRVETALLKALKNWRKKTASPSFKKGRVTMGVNGSLFDRPVGLWISDRCEARGARGRSTAPFGSHLELSHHSIRLIHEYKYWALKTRCDGHSRKAKADKRDEEGGGVMWKHLNENNMRNKIDKRGVRVVWSFSRRPQFVAEIHQLCPHPPSPTVTNKWENLVSKSMKTLRCFHQELG